MVVLNKREIVARVDLLLFVLKSRNARDWMQKRALSYHLSSPKIYPYSSSSHPFCSMSTQTYPLFCMGNPLLDMQATNGEELLKKYDLKANDAILAEEKHSSMYAELVFRSSNWNAKQEMCSYDDVVKYYNVTYVAGGAAQNAARGAAVSSRTKNPILHRSLIILQYILPPNSVVYTGCVGDDDLAEQLKAANKREGLTEAYLVKKGEKTGACAVVITGHHR